MFLDDIAIEIISKHLGFDFEMSEEFKTSYYEALVSVTNQQVVAFIADNNKERLEQIDKLLLSNKAEDRKRGEEILTDQIKLHVYSYEELKDEIKEMAKQYDNRLFFYFIGNASKEGALELLQYLSDKIDSYVNVKEILKLAGDDEKKKAIEEFFSEDSDHQQEPNDQR